MGKLFQRAGSMRGLLVATMALAGACSDGGTTDPTPTVPTVAGNYTLSEAIPAASCSPNQLPSGGIVVLTAFTQVYPVRIEQSGSVIRIVSVDFPDDPETGTIDSDGRITTSSRIVFQEDPRAGNRVFFVDLLLERSLQFDRSTGRITGTASANNVFREGSSTAAIFTTCNRQGATVTLSPR
ncbi:MAG: hypothetical protein ABI556_11960 [Gemmatimonadales bacterium]